MGHIINDIEYGTGFVAGVPTCKSGYQNPRNTPTTRLRHRDMVGREHDDGDIWRLLSAGAASAAGVPGEPVCQPAGACR